MKNPKKLGIWMDHSIAHLMEFTDGPFEIKTIESKFPEKRYGHVEGISESERQKQDKYYKKLGNEIKNYCQVILFGPTDAKMELYNMLSEDLRFVEIQMEIKETDMMTRSQLHCFVNEYFSVSA